MFFPLSTALQKKKIKAPYYTFVHHSALNTEHINQKGLENHYFFVKLKHRRKFALEYDLSVPSNPEIVHTTSQNQIWSPSRLKLDGSGVVLSVVNQIKLDFCKTSFIQL